MTAQLTGPEYGLPVVTTSRLADQIRQAAEQSSSARLVELGLEGEPHQTTCGELFAKALSFCAQLRQSDPGLPLILAFDRASDFIPAAWAAILLGRWYVPWQTTAIDAAGNTFMVRLKALQQCFPKANFVTNARLEAIIPTIMAECPQWSVRKFDHSHDVTNANCHAIDATEAGCYLATSGTTGGARFARIHEHALYFRYVTLQRLATDQLAISCFPFDGVSGHNVIFPWSKTRLILNTARLMSRPGDLVGLVREYRVNILSLSTTMLARLVSVLEDKSIGDSLASLNHVSLGSEPLSPVLIRRFLACREKAGIDDVSMSFSYGMTESSLIASKNLQTTADVLTQIGDGAGPVRLGSCCRYMAVRITDENDQLLPLGEQGHIQVHSAHRMFDGYQTSVGLDRSCFTSDDWFRTGDIGLVDGGQLIVLGRHSVSMSLNGRTISLEQIETGLHEVEGVEPGTVVASSVSSKGAITDKLILFFSPKSASNMASRQLANRLRHAVISLVGFSPDYLVPVPAERIKRTATAKVIRPHLVEAFKTGELKALEFETRDLSPKHSVLNSLRHIWSKQLNIAPDFASNSNFFDLGADSLDAADMILSVENKFCVRLPLEQFFQSPTMDGLARLVNSSAGQEVSAEQLANKLDGERIRKLESLMATWPGNRNAFNSLIVGLNLTGTAIPLFWVFQESHEFLRLANKMGKDYPLFGLRSMAGIVPVREYDAAMLNAVCDRYVPEILALKQQRPFIIGGNCQGGIVALAIARRLRRLDCSPEKLVLMEWSYSYGAYENYVELLYGRDSDVARYYTRECTDGPDWRGDFIEHRVNAIDGAHGQFFSDKKNLDSLARQIRRILGNGSPMEKAQTSKSLIAKFRRIG